MSDTFKQIVLFAVCTLALVWIASRMIGNSAAVPPIAKAIAVESEPIHNITPTAIPEEKWSTANTLRSSRAAPDPEVLRGDADLQAAYDSGARPGDFVTPPAVSVDH